MPKINLILKKKKEYIKMILTNIIILISLINKKQKITRTLIKTVLTIVESITQQFADKLPEKSEDVSVDLQS